MKETPPGANEVENWGAYTPPPPSPVLLPPISVSAIDVPSSNASMEGAVAAMWPMKGLLPLRPRDADVVVGENAIKALFPLSPLISLAPRTLSPPADIAPAAALS